MKMNIALVILLILCSIFSANGLEVSNSLDCKGKTFENVTLAAYFVNYDEDDSSDNVYLDVRGKKLRTLQDYIDERGDFVTIAMDASLKLPYATRVCIPELNYHYGRRLEFQIRDIGSDLFGKKFQRADICVRTEEDSYDNIVNRKVTMVF